ncbi:MYG1 exonuclease isoform X1 [Octopus bimaculoides]|uniref:Uncharacterized protein n=2 Tax=Octopus bimaculoides TaxID=37653 RepID=A0A0L8H202_OCTBM|nr:MYG1 exonuclease isoform X1 [Octopus bimaculoides]|eukprot:XP_014776093.1 PREDICTED: UPF0160 protein MYG1, mitochondrial-like isoform X1 [Octopus bimaculoides]
MLSLIRVFSIQVTFCFSRTNTFCNMISDSHLKRGHTKNSSDNSDTAKKSAMVKKIGTHNGTFHCDEALACFLLRLLPEYEDSTIIRTRDSEKLATCDVVVDVGGVYDPSTFRFDHHQRSFNESMSSLNSSKKWTTKLSSAGLVYYHFGERIIQNVLKCGKEDNKIVTTIFDKVYERFIEEIDGIDNGINQCECTPKYIISTNLSGRVSHLNPLWNCSDTNEEDQFKKAMELVGSEFLERVTFYKNSWIPARKIVKQAIEERYEIDKSGEVLLLKNGGCPWKDHLLSLEQEMDISPKIKYVLFTDQNGCWRILCVPVELGSFTNRLSLPEEWRGLRNEELSEKSGIKGCVFVHAGGFIGGNKTYDGIIEMAQVALAQKRDE